MVVGAKGRTRSCLFVGVLFGPFRAQISSTLLVHVGHCLCLFVLVVAEFVMIFGTGCLAACGSAYGNHNGLFLGVCCDASMGREGALYLKLIYLYPWVFVGGAVLTSLGFFWQACKDLLKQCRLFCLSGPHSGDFAILLCEALTHFCLHPYNFTLYLNFYLFAKFS